MSITINDTTGETVAIPSDNGLEQVSLRILGDRVWIGVNEPAIVGQGMFIVQGDVARFKGERSTADIYLVTESGQAAVGYTDQGYQNMEISPNSIKSSLADASQDFITVQNPLPTDGDSIYVKDLDLPYCDNGNFDGSVVDYFDSLKSVNYDNTANNPKSIMLWFKRTVYSFAMGIGCDDLGSGFGTDVTLKLLGSGGAVRLEKNFTGIDPNSALLEFAPAAFNGLIIEFNTADPVCLSNMTLRKTAAVDAHILAQRPDGTIFDVQATQQGNFKISLEELENQVSDDANSKLRVSPYAWDGVTASRLKGDTIFPGAPVVVTEAQYKIHQGDNFYICDYQLSVGNGVLIQFLLTTPDTAKWGHLAFLVSSTTGATIEVYEGATSNPDGTLIVPENNNRNSATLSGMVVRQNPTGIVTGSRISGYVAGSNRSAGFVERDNEVILKQNETYLFRITSLAALNNISWCAEWYEHISGQ